MDVLKNAADSIFGKERGITSTMKKESAQKMRSSPPALTTRVFAWS